MVNGIRLKICGLTSLVDAESADRAGADFLGFNLFEKSPRRVTLASFRSLVGRLPARKKVAVMVEPSATELTEASAAGFDFFQIHFPVGLAVATVADWAEAVGSGRLWLAPRLRPGTNLPLNLLPLTQTFLLDTYDAEKAGGTGRTGDWVGFRRHQETHPAKTWILAGGLNPENIGRALAATGAKFVDVNSGVEASPGVKDAAKLSRLVAQMCVSTGAA
jgi:phosphoribosylanthranilate isomerase